MSAAAEMQFFMPETIAEAVGLLGRSKNFRCLAGGGLVVPDLATGARPAGLISLKRVAGLRGIEALPDGGVRIGAMTPHVDVVQSTLLEGGLAVVRRAAAEIAHPVIRNMATIGGSLCRADPSADYICALLAAGATVHLRTPAGDRAVAIADFLIGDGKTARRQTELLVAVSLPGAMGPGAMRPGEMGPGSSGYARFSRVDGDYPVASAAVRLSWRDGAVAAASVAIGGCGPMAYRVVQADALLRDARHIADVPEDLITAAVAAALPKSDIKGTAEFRRMLIPGLLRRALSQAFAEIVR